MYILPQSQRSSPLLRNPQHATHHAPRRPLHPNTPPHPPRCPPPPRHPRPHQRRTIPYLHSHSFYIGQLPPLDHRRVQSQHNLRQPTLPHIPRRHRRTSAHTPDVVLAVAALTPPELGAGYGSGPESEFAVR
jgi:hypothetical protein